MKKLLEGETYQVRWIEDLRHIKKGNSNDFFIKGSFYCESIVRPGEYVSESLDVNLLFDKPIGTHIKFEDHKIKVVASNSILSKEYFISEIEESALGVNAQRVYSLLGINLNEITTRSGEILRDVCNPLGLDKFESLLYSNGHLIKNTGDSDHDYFIIPSFEVFRYFFLKGSDLTSRLMSYFTSEEEFDFMRNDNLYFHSSDCAKPIVNERGRRVANLFLTKNFKHSEKECVFRIAFVSNAYLCMERLIDSVIINNIKEVLKEGRNMVFNKISTVLPMDLPFKIAVCGNTFEFSGKSYLMVNQIYDVKETLPYDEMEFSLITDYSKNFGKYIKGGGIKEGVRNMTSPSSITEISKDESGNKDEPGNLEIVMNGLNIFGNVHLPIKHLAKEEQEKKYGSSSVNNILRNILSLTEGVGSDENIGRIKTEHKTVTEYLDLRRAVFLQSLKLVDDYVIQYLQLKPYPSKFIDGQCFNESYNNLVFCQIKNEDNLCCYLVRIDTNDYQRVRYGVFSTIDFQEIDSNKIYILATEHFAKLGLSTKIIGKFKDLFSGKKIERCNQGNDTPEVLAQKIKERLKNHMV